MKLWQQESGWDYYYCDLDDDTSFFPVFESLCNLWRHKRGDKLLPAWKDFAFEDFIGWHKHLILYEVMTTPFDLKYRLFGTYPTYLFGRDCTGHMMRGDDNDIEDDCDLHHFQKLYDENLIGASSGSLYWRNRDFIKLTVLDLPLSSDGENVTHFLSTVIEATE